MGFMDLRNLFRAFWRPEDRGLSEYQFGGLPEGWEGEIDSRLRAGDPVGLISGFTDFKETQKRFKYGHNLIWICEPRDLVRFQKITLLWHPSSEKSPHLLRFRERAAWIKNCARPGEFEEFYIPL